MSQGNVPLYLDWTFWAVIVAMLAVVLSQLPPLHQLFRPAKLTMDVFSRMHITHKIGNPNAQLHVILTNVGGREVKVTRVAVRVRRDGKEVAELSALNYLQQPNDERSVLFTRITLKPKDEWAHLINFLNLWSRGDEKKYRAAELAIRNDINAQIKARHDAQDKTQELVEAPAVLVAPFNRMFDDQFIWHPGEYELTVTVGTAPAKAAVSHTFRFTLFESDATELEGAKEDFRFGDGVYWNSTKHPGVIVQIGEA